MQRSHADARLRHRSDPLVNRRAADPVGCDDHRAALAVQNLLDRYRPDAFQRPMIKTAYVPLYAYILPKIRAERKNNVVSFCLRV